ncbi:MAG: 50S ribosomal protein L13 [Candidatus Bathyarchaeota archaeon]|jgi:large subunit ribosomal protein L13|nr:50S ribosomal protein L13 [Candidatus Bathyarchaeota archaeon]
MKLESERTIIVDASNLILGRLATVVAKKLLRGESVVILNAEKAIISGNKLSRVKEAKRKLEIGHPRKGPFWPRRPDRFVKRTIRGMLPRRKAKGKEAYRRLRVFVGIPHGLDNRPVESIPEASADKLKCSVTTVGELVKEIGWISRGE